MSNTIKKIPQNSFILILTILILTSCSQKPEQPNTIVKDYDEVTLFSTEKRALHSEIVNDDFEIYISLPYMYATNDTTYPVLFCLDANIKFGLVSTVVNSQGTLTKEIPEIIVVGIAYQMNGLEDWVIGRNRDFTPTKLPENEKYWVDRLSKATGRDDIVISTGHADKFIAFITDELIPFIESEYRVSKDRAIHGTSLGGLFSLYALFQKPETFQKFYAGSPSIKWDEDYMYQLENDFAASHRDLPARLFMCVGGLESESYINNMNKMDSLLRSRNYPNLEIESIVFENETHGSTVPASISRGLKMLYEKK